MDLLDRLATKFTVGDGCWEWTGAKTGGGYGVIRVEIGSDYAHRVLYEIFVGPIPEGLVIDHICRNRGCVRPNHLRAVTSRENSLAPGSLSIAAARSKMTHCLRGHEYTETTTYVGKRGRSCRVCERDRSRRRRATSS